MTDAATDQRAFGLALRDLRNRAGITQAELAARASSDDTYISRIEHGRISVGWHTTMRLLRALDASPNDLAVEVERHGPPSAETPARPPTTAT